MKEQEKYSNAAAINELERSKLLQETVKISNTRNDNLINYRFHLETDKKRELKDFHIKVDFYNRYRMKYTPILDNDYRNKKLQ